MPQETHDPRVLRAIAHPTRSRVLAELGASGSLRAADIARALDIPANQASFHLRQLAKYGLVEEDPDAARDKRDRVWRLADDRGIRLQLGAMEHEPGGEAATKVFRENFAEWAQFLAVRAMGGEGAPHEDELYTINDSSIRLTKQEAESLLEELGEVFDRWRERTRGDGAERTTYSYLTILQPYPDLRGVS